MSCYSCNAISLLIFEGLSSVVPFLKDSFREALQVGLVTCLSFGYI